MERRQPLQKQRLRNDVILYDIRVNGDAVSVIVSVPDTRRIESI